MSELTFVLTQMKPLVLQVRSSSTKRDISMHSAAQYGSGTSSTSDWKGQRKAWVAEQRQRRRASRAQQQRLQRSHLDEDALATGYRFSAFPRMMKALDRHSMESELSPLDGGTPESPYGRPRAPLNWDPSSQGAFTPRNTSTHHRRPSNPSSAADSPITAPVMRNRDLVEPVYDETLGPSPEQLQDSYISSGLPYDSPPPSYRSSRARNETALNGGSADRSELALRRYAHDEAMPDTYRADAYTPRQQTRQIQDARNAVWPSRSGARSVRFPGLQQPSHFWNNSMPPVPDPEPFTPCVTEDNASRSRRVSDYDYEMGFSAEYSDHRSVEYYTEASYRRAEYYPAPYLDTSTTDWDADPAAVEDVTAYEHSGQMDAESPDILPEKRASDAQCLEHNEAFSHSQVSAVTSQYPLQPVRAAEHVTQSAREQGEGSKSLIDMASTPKPNARVSPSVCQDSTGHTHSSTSNWKSDSSPQEELRQGQECGTSKQPTDGDLATATPSAASKNSVSSNQPSTTMHSPSEGNNAAPSAVWESLFTKSKSTAGGEGTASASGTPGGVWDSLFDDAACSGTKHVNRPQDHSGSAAERRRAQDTEPEEAQQSQGIANSSSPAAAVPSIQPERFSAAELDNHESSFTTGSDSLPVGSVASPKERTQDEYAPRAHASSIIQAATNCANKHKAQYQDPRQHASAVGGEDAGTLHFDAHPVHSKPSGKMQDSVSTATDSTSRVVSAAEYSHDQAKISSAQRHPGRHSAVYTAAGAAGASLFLLQSLAPQERTTTQQITSTKGNVADSADAPETEVSLAAEENTPREEEQVLQSTAVSDVLEASSSFAEQGTSSPFASTSSALAPDAAFISRSAAPDEVCSHRENTSTRDILVTADPVLEPEVAEVLPEEGKMVLVTPQMQAPKIQSSVWASERAEDRWREQLPPSARKVVDFAEGCGRVWGMMFPKKSEEQLQVEREIRKAVMKGDLHWSALNQVQQGKPIMPEQIAEAKRMAQQ